ncbi:MAG TPA: DUF11 domain-containing protein, partial [Blastocatellia bacterium]|nr:DUF11 domain-containing protein [Blastocatellia bacterium]
GLSLGDLTPSAVVLTEIPLAVGAAGQTPAGITTGPDNNVWFAEFSISAIGRLSPGTPPPSADIAVSIQAPATIGTGDQLTSTITVTNSGPQTANNVTAVFDVPNGTTFVSAKGSGVIQPPAAGGNGTLTDSLGSLASGTAASFQVTLNVGGAQGSSIVANASASTTSTDPNTANNSAAATIAVKGGGVVMFVLTQPTPTAAVPFPAPIVTTIVPGSGTPPSADDTLAPQEIQPQDDTCGAPIGQNYYMAPDCNATMLPTDPHSFPWVFQGSTVQNPGGGNVFVPTVGAVYIVTNVFQCAGPPASTVESLASNIVSVCGGPTITGFKLKAGKFRIFGTNFASNAAVFINSTKATGKLVRSTTVLLLKGAILSQVPIGTSLISVEQPGSSTTFGISTFTLDRTQ